eukprot:CAMPEP_0117044610 /NCGR_PEP_ID=MMETSP0472-20121206/30914_1 /TAXON_ID=693140 ORGANISM="Tiarina fusus, Strain LIS" /NCGR_SAMPLE_ID=MMETSP0472 /ASSEMBLY_ACC=CAM_ASM_000603 /LENGTH=180 /DNA_ID=CAMNT_0004756399 /DNA_START=139 /DNA_END=681 /DNA_ORIENTATION=+
MPGTTEAIFTPIDLEASLGRIEDLQLIVSNEDAMDCEQEQTPRTSDNPFREAESKEQHVISPYPYSETESEIAERRRLHESVGKDWTLGEQPVQQQQPPVEPDWIELELIPDDDADNDEFSLSSEGSESLKAEEDVELEKIEDPVSFFETNVPASSEYPTVIPLCVSFASGCDAPDDMMC